ncbi:MAG TPA: hypothetical protein VKP03_00900, partial [Patescibacteria group bacterium]|nr:hypothetical protein [Patescibacteria group bacterium]
RFDSLEGVEKYNLHAFYAYADDFDIPGLKDHIKQNFKLVYSKERFDLFEQEVLVMKQELSEFNEFVNLPEIYNYKKKELDDIIEKYRLYLGVVALPSFSGEIEPHSAETIGGYDFVCVRDVVWFRKTDSSQLIQKLTDCSLYGQICEQGRCVEADLNDGDTDNFFEDSKSSFSGHDINSSMEKEVEKVEHAQMGSSPSVSSECSMNRNNRSNKISLILLSLLLLGLFSLREGRE